MKKRYYVLIGIVSYVLFTLINTPAATVISLLEKQINLPLKFYGVEGTIWNGQSDRIMMQGNPPIDNVQWSVNPAGFLLASLSADVRAQIKQQNIVGHINVSPGGQLEASDLRARLNAKDVQQLIAMPFGELGGEFNINIESLRMNGSELPETSGQIKWRNAKLTLLETVDLGHVELNIKPAEGGALQADIRNKGGDLSISGSVLLMNNKRYTVDLSFVPQNNASENVKQSLGMFASRQSNGSYLLKKSDSLRKLGL